VGGKPGETKDKVQKPTKRYNDIDFEQPKEPLSWGFLEQKANE
jgi:hypothetical protein